MSERTNTDVVQQGYEALGRGDIPALLQFLTVDVEWTQHRARRHGRRAGYGT